MPNMDGLTFLRKIMALRPMPVVMISTLTQAGADVTLEALEIGAVDFIAKPTERCRGSDGRARRGIADQGQGCGAHARRRRARRLRRRALARVAPSSRSATKDRRHRRFDRRRRGAEVVLMGLPVGLPADPHHPAHAAALHRGLRGTAESRMSDAGLGSRHDEPSSPGMSISPPARIISRSRAQRHAISSAPCMMDPR